MTYPTSIARSQHVLLHCLVELCRRRYHRPVSSTGRPSVTEIVPGQERLRVGGRAHGIPIVDARAGEAQIVGGPRVSPRGRGGEAPCPGRSNRSTRIRSDVRCAQDSRKERCESANAMEEPYVDICGIATARPHGDTVSYSQRRQFAHREVYPSACLLRRSSSRPLPKE
jgi:hypothetical protein